METRGEQMLALRKARMAASPPILRGGFRPFFLFGSLWAVISLIFWLASLFGGQVLPTPLDPLSWHRHEMLFGFVGAVVAGFLLTAIPNWTGRLPIAGLPLAALFGLWLAGRLALLFSVATGIAVAAALDVGFYLVLACAAAREVVASRNRNLPIVGLVLLFAGANALDYMAASGVMQDGEIGFRAGIALVLLMIALIGGRIIPSFTRNWMTKNGIKDHLPTQPSRFDLVTIAVAALALIAWVLSPASSLTGVALAVAGLLQLIRLWRWRGWRTRRDPLVLILHVGYAWLPAGLLLLALSILDETFPRTTAIHALTAGAMATMILAMMTRAALGHTGRELKANSPTVLIYLLVTAGAILRVIAPLGATDYQFAIETSGLLWGGAFLLFLLSYGTVLFRARADKG